MKETVNNHFKSLLNNLLIKALNEEPIYKDSYSCCWECLQIKKNSGWFDILIGQPINKDGVYFGISYKQDLTNEQKYLIEQIFKKWKQ